MLMSHLAKQAPDKWSVRTFDPTDGSDERQYNAPGFQLPIGQIARTIYGKYDGYHNSLDTKEYMGIETLVESIDGIGAALQNLEVSGISTNLSPYGEPQLGKRGLYPTMNAPEKWQCSTDWTFDQRKTLNRLLYLLSYSDGNHSILDIIDKCDCSIEEIRPIVELLEKENLLKVS